MAREKTVFLILHNIRSAHNVGSMFRTADTAGVTKIFLTGYTPTPLDRFGRARKELSKVALGGEKTVPWEYHKNISALISKLKKSGTYIIAIEQAKNSTDYKKVRPKLPAAFIVGNEVSGVSPAILKKCDVVAEISMKGKKESLNVGVSLGIALFRILNI